MNYTTAESSASRTSDIINDYRRTLTHARLLGNLVPTSDWARGGRDEDSRK